MGRERDRGKGYWESWERKDDEMEWIGKEEGRDRKECKKKEREEGREWT